MSNRYEKPEYDADCPACLQNLFHTVEQHNAALARQDNASSYDNEDDEDEN